MFQWLQLLWMRFRYGDPHAWASLPARCDGCSGAFEAGFLNPCSGNVWL